MLCAAEWSPRPLGGEGLRSGTPGCASTHYTAKVESPAPSHSQLGRGRPLALGSGRTSPSPSWEAQNPNAASCFHRWGNWGAVLVLPLRSPFPLAEPVSTKSQGPPEKTWRPSWPGGPGEGGSSPALCSSDTDGGRARAAGTCRPGGKLPGTVM